MEFVTILSSLLGYLPMLAVYIVIIVLAVVRWQRHPRASLFATLGAASLILLAIINQIIVFMLPSILRATNSSIAVYSTYNLVYTFFVAGAWVFIVLAIFSDRLPFHRVNQPLMPPYPNPQPPFPPTPQPFNDGQPPRL